jgi:hypothetical protein
MFETCMIWPIFSYLINKFKKKIRICCWIRLRERNEMTYRFEAFKTGGPGSGSGTSISVL